MDYESGDFRRLIKWAIVQGIIEDYDSLPDDDKAFFSAETVSRVWAVKSLRQIQPDLDIVQTDLQERFDCQIYSGGTWQKIEHKYRNYPDTFSDYGLSRHKYEYCLAKGIWYLTTLSDGTYYLWDLAKAKPDWRDWKHNKETVNPAAGQATEKAPFLKPEDAIFRGKICQDKKS